MQGVCSVYNWNETESRHRDPHYIISLRAEGSASVEQEGDKCILAVPQRQTSNSLVSTPISKWPFKSEQRANTAGKDFVSVSVILVHLSAVHHGRNRQTWHTGHIWFPIGDEMVRGWQQCEAALQHSAVSKAICISGADCEAPAGTV